MITYEDVQLAVQEIDYTVKMYNQEELEFLERLAESIKTKGLGHPILVERQSNGRFLLVKGRQRITAFKMLGRETIACRIIPSGMTENEKREFIIELRILKENLPWYDQVVLVKELHDLRQVEHGVATRSGLKDKKTGWSLRDTARELDMGLGTVSQDIRLAEAVLKNPGLKKIEDKVTARRLIFQEMKRDEAELEAGISTKIEKNVVYCGDSSEILVHFPDRTFDACFTDPPWLEYKDRSLVKDDRTILVFEEVYRVLKADSFLYVICSTPDFFIYQTELEKFGFKVQQMPLLWVKKNVVSHGLRSWEYMRDYEPILLAVKGAPVLVNSTPPSAVWTSPAVHPTKLIHPNEKPIDVPTHFLSHCTYEGSLVLDPFGGSGVTAEACINLGRNYVVIERDKKFHTNIERRLDQRLLEREAERTRQGEVRELPESNVQEDSAGAR